ncbi:MAG: (d)CMP kinase [Chlamydiota bacterium]
MIITIDGPSGTGKSSAAKKLAERLGIAYFDTGAMYRGLAWYCLEHRVSIEEVSSLEKALKNFSFIITKKGEYVVSGVNITTKIRSEEIALLSSKLSSYPSVRQKLVQMQKAFGKKGPCVFEGRDMGSVVFQKEAARKFFFTANPKIRAQRRHEQLLKKSSEKTHSLAEIEKQMAARDEADRRRTLSPLKKTGDMIEIDTTDLSLNEVVLLMLKYIPLKKMRLFYRMAFYFSCWVARRFYRFRVYGKERRLAGSALIIANHTSYMDPPLAVMAFGEELHFLARKSLFRNRLFRWLISTLKAHPITSGKKDIGAVKTTLEVLKNGEKILLFPEGGRSDGETLLPLEPGIGFLAYKSGAPIIPMYIEGAQNVWGKRRKFPTFFGDLSCVIGPVLSVDQYRHLDKKAFIEKVLEESEKALKELRAELKKQGPHP